MRRLRNSAGMLALDIPLTDTQIDARFRETMRVAGLGEDGGRGLSEFSSPAASVS
jgi:hypothetical protein